MLTQIIKFNNFNSAPKDKQWPFAGHSVIHVGKSYLFLPRLSLTNTDELSCLTVLHTVVLQSNFSINTIYHLQNCLRAHS